MKFDAKRIPVDFQLFSQKHSQLSTGEASLGLNPPTLPTTLILKCTLHPTLPSKLPTKPQKQQILIKNNFKAPKSLSMVPPLSLLIANPIQKSNKHEQKKH
jgi:hypothetical protein